METSLTTNHIPPPPKPQFLIPETIQLDDIVRDDRARSEYNFIESLAENIGFRGTETPIVVSPLANGKWLLEAGGRRVKALELLGVETLYYASVAVPGRPGFVVKNRISTVEDHALSELIENLYREGMDWRDELKLIVKAWRAKSLEAGLSGARLTYAVFGKMLGNYGYSDINCALNVHDAVFEHPDWFKDCKSIATAYVALLKKSKEAIAEELAGRVVQPAVKKLGFTERTILAEGPAQLIPDYPLSPTFDLTSRFKLTDSLDWMDTFPDEFFDHIVCDPDFAVSVEQLEAGVAGAADGVVQESVALSLAVLKSFLEKAFRLTKGYCIFFYDVVHQEKLLTWTESIGFRTQRWPVIWHKTDYRGNAAPQHNFCKNIEYAMVCRKPSATLAEVQMSSVISLPSGNTTKEFGHPFAKPPELWKKLYKAAATPGQKTLDPFMGAASSVAAALDLDLIPYGGELQERHYHTAVLNIQKRVNQKFGDSVIFQ